MAPQHRERRIGQQPPTSLLGQLALKGCPDALAWFTTAAHWPPVAVLEPDHHTRGTDEGDQVHTGDAARIDAPVSSAKRKSIGAQPAWVVPNKNGY